MKYVLVVEWRDSKGDLHQRYKEYSEKAPAMSKAIEANGLPEVTEVKVYEVSDTAYGTFD